MIRINAEIGGAETEIKRKSMKPKTVSAKKKKKINKF